MQSSDRELRMQLMQMTTGYWRSQVLFAACELGVFEAVANGPLSAKEIALRCGTSGGHTERLLNGCVACDLLEKRDGRYLNTRLASSLNSVMPSLS